MLERVFVTLKHVFGKCSLFVLSANGWKDQNMDSSFSGQRKPMIWRRHCSIGQSCCSMTSKRIDWFLESSRAWFFVCLFVCFIFVSLCLFVFVLFFCCLYRGYYMAARGYEISLRVLKNMSRVSAANKWNIFLTREEKFRISKRPEIVFWSERWSLLWSHSKGDIFTCEDIKFSRESSLGISLVFI